MKKSIHLTGRWNLMSCIIFTNKWAVCTYSIKWNLNILLKYHMHNWICVCVHVSIMDYVWITIHTHIRTYIHTYTHIRMYVFMTTINIKKQNPFYTYFDSGDPYWWELEHEKHINFIKPSQPSIFNSLRLFLLVSFIA